MSKVVKRCSCGRCYTAEAFASLAYVGVMADEVEAVELRNCTCGSTISISLGTDAVLAAFLGPQLLS